MVEENGFMSKAKWMSNWEAVWQGNLDRCDVNGACNILVS